MVNCLLLISLFTQVRSTPTYTHGAVVSVEPYATKIGVEVMRSGGNAVDAAVATAFALAVTHPEAGNIGGGGFMVVRLGETGEAFTIDFRETAPRSAHAGMFLNAEKKIDPAKSGFGWKVVGVPGSPMGLWIAHQKAGKKPWKELVHPAVVLARDGFVVDEYLSRGLAKHAKRFQRFPGSASKVFLPNGSAPAANETFRQPDLATVLATIRDNGPDGFYRGPTADRLVASMKEFGGLVTRQDLADYRAIIRIPVRGFYRGFEVISMPPPSSGGTVLIEMLNILEGFTPTVDAADPQRLHQLVEAMRRAYLDRARHLGDTDFIEAPTARLLSKEYAIELRKSIDPRKATASAILGADIFAPEESDQTTHFSVVDSAGTMVACTTTLEDAYGSAIAAPGLGFLLNNQMHDFNLKPGLTDALGRIGTPANCAAPGKRMLSSMTPTLVLKDGKPFLVLGSPGGRTIINTVLQVLLNVVDYKMPIQEAVDFGRIHHQWMPDDVKCESRLPTKSIEALAKFGHQTTAGGKNIHVQGDCHAVQIELLGTSLRLRPGVDRRLRGAEAGF